MSKILIKNAFVVNENQTFKGSVLIENEFITQISQENIDQADAQIIDATGLYLLPGMIDDQVHFRDPGLTHKGDLNSESRSAVAGGITSFMEMPNTNPRCLTQELLADKFKLGQEKSLANYSFYMGTSNDNLEEVLKTNPSEVCGIKIFLGASTGNMLVDNPETIEKVLEFSARTGLIVTVHSEDENIIINNSKIFREKYGDELDVSFHPKIRSHESCVISTEKIIKLAQKTHGNLHILHLSTADEMKFFSPSQDIDTKKITAEVCVHHLWFSEEDYATKGSFIKWNPAIKGIKDRDALRSALKEGRLDIIATDHAPHTLEEKSQTNYFMCPSGGPLVQHALVAVLELVHEGIIDLETAVTKTSHNISKRYKIDRRGFIKPGYYADLVLVDLNSPWLVDKSNLLYKCAWSPFEGTKFNSKIKTTIINGTLVYDQEKLKDDYRGKKLLFLRGS
jgi:dihydroorotase